MNKILFSDFDGTLFFKEGFHQEDIEAIKTFQSKGNKFALCTGRPLGGVNALMKGKIIPDYYVLCTGGLVLDKDYQVIYAQEIPFELVKEVCQKYENETIIGPHCLDEKYLYFKYVPNDAPSYIKQFDSIDEFKDRKIYSFSLIESTRAKEITDEINKDYPSLHAFQNVNAIYVVKKGCSKGNGILEITKLISDETAGIGDSYNDLEMFKVVNQSFTFKTSPKDIQQQTRYTVSSVKMAIDILNKE